MTVIDLGAPALVVVDMQNSFCHPDGHRADVGLDHTESAAVVAPIAHLLAASRAAGIPVAFTRYALKADYSDAGLMLERWPGIKSAGALVAGTWSAEIVPELSPVDGEHVIDKTRHSAFYKTELEALLHRLGVDTLIVCGVTTNICVESTVRDSFARDFRVIVPGDGTAAPTREMHQRGLMNVEFAFGVVSSVAEIVVALHALVTSATAERR